MDAPPGQFDLAQVFGVRKPAHHPARASEQHRFSKLENSFANLINQRPPNTRPA